MWIREDDIDVRDHKGVGDEAVGSYMRLTRLTSAEEKERG